MSVTEVKKSNVTKRSYKLVPPDGGYGYVILSAVGVNFTATLMFGVCFGIIYNDFFIQMQMGAAEISLLTGINAMSVAVAGFLTGPLLKHMSRRTLALIGSVFFNSGTFATVFVNTKAQLLICQGLLQSFGLGFIYNISYAVLNDYFTGKRFFAMSFSQTIPALAAMIAPIIVTWSRAEYGFRGPLVVVTAFGIQTFVASLLLHPVEWHMKKEFLDVSVPEEEPMLQIDKSADNFDTKKKIPQSLETPTIKLPDVEKADNFSYEEKKNNKPSTWGAVITWIKDFLDWPFFKEFILTCGCLGPPLAIFADLSYVFFLAQALYDLKWDADQVKWAFTLIGFGDIAGRIILIFCSAWLKKLGSHLLYVIGLLIAIATKLALLKITDYMACLTIITILGISRCTISVVYPLVLADSVKPEQFPSAMGISQILFGVISFALGPAVGAIRDATGDYTVMFLVNIGILAATALAWIIELLHGRRKTKKTVE